MILVDRALREREAERRPIQVGLIGAGFMGRGICLQIERYTPGMKVVAIYSRNADDGRRAYREAGVEDAVYAPTAPSLEAAVAAGRQAVVDDPHLICESERVDAIVEVTGTVELGARVVLAAIENRKHVVMMNAELDGTVGPILKRYADRACVVLTNSGGDQPGVIMDLYRFVVGIGAKPVLCGNIKGLHDRYRNPTTQDAFARRWGQKAHIVTTFADGTKTSFEQAIVANATGMRVAKRGMHGPVVAPGTPVEQAASWYPLDDLLEGPGIVDYVVGAAPSPGVFVLATHEDDLQKHYLNLYKMGEGPLYCFYTPYHLCHFEVPTTVARAVLFGDSTVAPVGEPVVDVVGAAKQPLKAGEVLDGMGFYKTYGLAENSSTVWRERLLPVGLAEGCRLRRDVERDEILRVEDVELPRGRLADRLRDEQNAHFHGEGAPRPGRAQALS